MEVIFYSKIIIAASLFSSHFYQQQVAPMELAKIYYLRRLLTGYPSGI